MRLVPRATLHSDSEQYLNTEDNGSYFTVPHLLEWRLFKLKCAVTVLWLRAEHGFFWGGGGGFWTRATLFCLFFYTTLSRRENLILPLGVLQTRIFLPVHTVFPSNILYVVHFSSQTPPALLIFSF
jgi:hypothetical protein